MAKETAGTNYLCEGFSDGDHELARVYHAPPAEEGALTIPSEILRAAALSDVRARTMKMLGDLLASKAPTISTPESSTQLEDAKGVVAWLGKLAEKGGTDGIVVVTVAEYAPNELIEALQDAKNTMVVDAENAGGDANADNVYPIR